MVFHLDFPVPFSCFTTSPHEPCGTLKLVLFIGSSGPCTEFQARGDSWRFSWEVSLILLKGKYKWISMGK